MAVTIQEMQTEVAPPPAPAPTAPAKAEPSAPRDVKNTVALLRERTERLKAD
jgi:hypothetical protein